MRAGNRRAQARARGTAGDLARGELQSMLVTNDAPACVVEPLREGGKRQDTGENSTTPHAAKQFDGECRYPSRVVSRGRSKRRETGRGNYGDLDHRGGDASTAHTKEGYPH